MGVGRAELEGGGRCKLFFIGPIIFWRGGGQPGNPSGYTLVGLLRPIGLRRPRPAWLLGQ